ncbi:MAG: hypothetical protein PHI86_01365 [Candidatus Omnitrophica bacterium]|nr:hypothetical protein [Candidatus Omnitrophota bacterium]HOX54517.1 hypothetical protein [Candidatus Omnitrophota bacterium]
MRLSRFFVILILVTMISLLYVQMQVAIFQSAYAASDKESQVRDLLDTKTVLVYNINRLESAQNIGNKVLCSKTDLQFTAEDQIASLKLPAQLAKSWRVNSSVRQSHPRYNLFAYLFNLGSQAEATERIRK